MDGWRYGDAEEEEDIVLQISYYTPLLPSQRLLRGPSGNEADSLAVEHG